MLIDARGEACPRPVLMAEEAVAGISEGAVEVIVDNDASVKNLEKFARKNGLYFESSKENGDFKVKLVKGYACAPALPEEALKEKDILLVIGTDTMGKDEALGRILMKGFFDTMKATGEMPHTIFFLNAGVRLTTTEKEIIPVLKELESRGVEIYSCGTCLKHYGLEADIKVGHRGSTNHIVEGMKDFQKTVWV